MSGLFGSAATTAASSSGSQTQGDLKGDVALNNPPTDTISGLAFSPGQNASDFLAISSWDQKVRIYEIAQNGQSEGRHAYDHGKPVFDVDFSKVGIPHPATARDTPPWPQPALHSRGHSSRQLQPALHLHASTGKQRRARETTKQLTGM